MATEGSAAAGTQRQEAIWKRLMLVFCAIGALWMATAIADNFGGSRPWYGWWDGSFFSTPGEPYSVTSYGLEAGGALAKAGFRSGDRFDVREQALPERIVLFTQPLTTHPVTFVFHRGSAKLEALFIGSTVWEGESLWKLLTATPAFIAGLWFLGCSLLVVLRRSSSADGRALAVILLCVVPGLFGNGFLVLPDATLTLLSYAILQASTFAALLLLVFLSLRFGMRSVLRRILESIAYAAIAIDVIWHAAFYVGVFTLRIDPARFWFNTNGVSTIDILVTLAVAIVAVAAVAATGAPERPRAAWLLLPLPVAFVISASFAYFGPFATTWILDQTLGTLASASMLLGAFLVTYALLQRRVLDFGFVLSRTIVVGIVSSIIVIAFVLLEWLLGTVLADVSRATGVIANAALALALGVSLRFIHKRVDGFVDAVMFRKRHEDERALQDYSKEAAFVTEVDELLDQSIGKVSDHTDAQFAALLLHENGSYKAIRTFGNAPADVGENDPAILALRTWHKPLDPHRYATRMHGDLALPMLARGRLLGVLVCGERAGGEAYAPDEVEALSQFAHGVGSALDGLRSGTLSNGSGELAASIQALRESVERGFAELRERSGNTTPH